MTSNSFRNHLQAPPSGYRTPSPPPHEFLNPTSPATAAWSAAWTIPDLYRKHEARPVNTTAQKSARGRKRKSLGKSAQNSVLADLANVAPLANRKGQHRARAPRGDTDGSSLLRPSKRAKSEHISTTEESEVNSRPHTSYHTHIAVQTADAELLLNFSRTASSEASNAARNGKTPTIQSPVELVDRHAPQRETEDRQGALANTSPKRDGLHLHSQSASHPEDLIAGQNKNNTKDSRLKLPAISVQLVSGATSPAHVQESSHSEANGTASSANQADVSQDPAVSVNQQTSGSESLSRQEKVETTWSSVECLEKTMAAPSAEPLVEHGARGDAAPAFRPLPKQAEDSPSICAGCNFHRNSLALESENDGDSWISCDGCKKWFHFACAGFKHEREVRSVDKFRCRQCKSVYGPTTYVRKSSRAHSAIDYAGLNEGIVKTSDENPLHHYIKPIREGTIKFDPENFARIRPELVTRDFFEKGDGMREPVVIPANFNPRPQPIPDPNLQSDEAGNGGELILDDIDIHDTNVLDDWRGDDFEFEQVDNQGQDALDMVIPIGLTVRKVSELYGPDEKIDVIDVKSQNGEDKKWTMRRWVDYYESKEDNKKVRNVISLEVSRSPLGALIRRPKVVRDLDLQDSVWPAELIAKGDFPKVQFYCLMSVADCYTDFHIDFGGSSVYYHILEGKKTFFFIPPHEKHLKKYEEWCNSPAQNWTFLGDQTKECYRVDLSAGDTMLIPAGWIHAVWTPEDSLVIGGNFLTRLNLPMQIRVTQIEKATFVDRKFRYPAFQKVMWYTAFHYLENDPIPEMVVEMLVSGQPFNREIPTHLDFDQWGENSAEGVENYHSRYYSKAELDGLPELARYLQRTALIAGGFLTEGITTKTQEAVKRSIPKGNGDPLQFVKRFAMWYTWKVGNETLPHWAYPDYVPEGAGAEGAEKKLSAKTMKRLDREAALQAWKVAPDRQSTRLRNPPQNLLTELATNQNSPNTTKPNSPVPEHTPNGIQQSVDETPVLGSPDDATTPTKKSRSDSATKTSGGRRPACEMCRKGRRACKHREDLSHAGVEDASMDDLTNGSSTLDQSSNVISNEFPIESLGPSENGSSPIQHSNLLQMDQLEIVQQDGNIGGYMSRLAGANDSTSLSQAKAFGRSKACKECRKSKRRCVHDENGNKDPAKLAEVVTPRPAAKKRKSNGEPSSADSMKLAKKSQHVDIESVLGNDFDDEAANGSVGDESTSPSSLQNTKTNGARPRATVTANIVGTSGLQARHAKATSTNATPRTVKHEGDESSREAKNPGPGASSLVSPPESAHTDTEKTPPAHGATEGMTPPAAVRSHPPSGTSLKTVPRYTPDSNPQVQASTDGDATSPTTSVDAGSTHRRRASRLTSDHEADEESLKLIRQLAAQDMGLRRRAKVV